MNKKTCKYCSHAQLGKGEFVAYYWCNADILGDFVIAYDTEYVCDDFKEKEG